MRIFLCTTALAAALAALPALAQTSAQTSAPPATADANAATSPATGPSQQDRDFVRDAAAAQGSTATKPTAPMTGYAATKMDGEIARMTADELIGKEIRNSRGEESRRHRERRRRHRPHLARGDRRRRLPRLRREGGAGAARSAPGQRRPRDHDVGCLRTGPQGDAGVHEGRLRGLAAQQPPGSVTGSPMERAGYGSLHDWFLSPAACRAAGAASMPRAPTAAW